MLKNIIERDGITGFYKGFLPTMLRQGIFSMTFLGVYNNVMELCPPSEVDVIF